MGKSKKIMNQRGVSLIFVVLVLIVLSILSVAIFTLFTSNMAQARSQQESIRVHYVAIAGVDVTMGALMQDNRSLLTNYFNKAITVSVADLSDRIDLDNGYADIVVSSYILDSERWVLITSTGHLSEKPNTIRVIKMNFRIEYPQIQNWE